MFAIFTRAVSDGLARPIPKSVVNLIKVIVTVISFIIAIACIGTGVLSPVGHALAQEIKALWRNNGEP